ncbi:MAG: membrane protein insertase YidC [Cytophagaceae bacterium]
MDRNQITGIVMITVLMLAYFVYMGNRQDKIADQPLNDTSRVKGQTTLPKLAAAADSAKADSAFGAAVQGEAREIILENKNEIKVHLNTRGGKVDKVLLKKFLTYDKKPLYVIDENSSQINLLVQTNKGKKDIYDLYYKASESKKGDTSLVTFRYDLAPGKAIVQTYSLAPESYVVKYDLQMIGMDQEIQNVPAEFVWNDNLPKNEADIEQARARSTINYYTSEEGFDNLSEASKDKETEKLDKKISWVSMKQKFFCSSIISKNGFEKGTVTSSVDEADMQGIKQLRADLFIPIGDLKSGKGQFEYYFGPVHYNTLKTVTSAEDFDKNVTLGWPVINWINRFVVIPVFNFLRDVISSYGIIIIILAILVKLITLPLSYKSQISMAKMRVLKPEMDEIKAKFPDDMQKQQVEQMALYKQVGINPLSGCIPVLLSMPVLLAMFSFFPNSIELRQESFLWANDLSTYDAPILLPFTIPFYGSHVSIFTLLMTLSTLAFTYFNNQMSASVQGPMKVVSYLMPVIFMFVLNSFPAGLSFYYFVSNILAIGQQMGIRKFVNEEQIRATLDENKKKNAAGGTGKKSAWMQRVDEAMRMRDDKKKK